ncbi:MAG: ribonuclease HI family protein [Anaerolineae bacterium]|nr:ribonuclease HI family protein [Anaerolineae bacterium]
MLRLYFDGLYKAINDTHISKAHAGFICYGWLVARDGVVIARGHGGYAEKRNATSSVAEYMALIEGLEALLDMGVWDEPVEVFGDARALIEQMAGNSIVSSPSIKKLSQKAKRLSRRFADLRWQWMPRRYNRQADALTRRAMNQICNDRGRYEDTVEKLACGTKRKVRAGKPILLVDMRVFQSAGLFC